MSFKAPPWALALVLSAAATVAGIAIAQDRDPRIALADLQLGRDVETALLAVEKVLAEEPDRARQLGFEYLRAHLLLQLDRRADALAALANSMTANPDLEAYSRFRLAQEQVEIGRPAVAAGLLASVLAAGPPAALADPALELFGEAIEGGGDCRLLRTISPLRFRPRGQRRLRLAAAGCAARDGQVTAAESALRELLAADHGDDVALAAARLLVRLRPEMDARSHMTVGMTFFAHREFEVAIQHLARTVASLPESTGLTRKEVFETRYALARSHFWQERYTVAAAAFRALAARTRTAELRSKVLYQQARCQELEDDWDGAIATYRAAYAAAPNGGWVDSSLMSQLRLLWRTGREDDALDVYETLVRRRRLGSQYRALLFIAASDLVQGRVDRAGAWLESAARLGRGPESELDYWQGRLAELRNDSAGAVGHYLDALRDDSHGPFASQARLRLQTPKLAGTAAAIGRKLAGSTRIDDLYGAWLLRGSDAVGSGARAVLAARLANDAVTGPFMRLSVTPPARWPLWQAALRQPEEKLLALGLWEHGAPVVLRHFPVVEPDLAFTGSLLLAQAGETRRSLYIAEVMRKRIPDRLPTGVLPAAFQRLLYPFRYGYLILRESERQGVDPYLLAAIIREESRFDPRAFSGAAARGLTQFVMPTAKRVGADLGMGEIAPHDLEQPEISIALAAAYLRELSAAFRGDLGAMVAAYNAGEPQSALWRRYCFSDDPAELYTKVTFRETRNYVLKVLRSHAHYVELYGTQPLSVPEPGA